MHWDYINKFQISYFISTESCSKPELKWASFTVVTLWTGCILYEILIYTTNLLFYPIKSNTYFGLFWVFGLLVPMTFKSFVYLIFWLSVMMVIPGIFHLFWLWAYMMIVIPGIFHLFWLWAYVMMVIPGIFHAHYIKYLSVRFNWIKQ
jgi:hypothetical protein